MALPAAVRIVCMVCMVCMVWIWVDVREWSIGSEEFMVESRQALGH